MGAILWERIIVLDITALISIMFWEGMASSLIIYIDSRNL